MAKALSLNKPWRVDDLEHRSPLGGHVYWVLDRSNVLVAIFSDQHQAYVAVGLVNGSDHVQAEIRGGN